MGINSSSDSQIYDLDADGGTTVLLTTDGDLFHKYPSWSPYGDRIAFAASKVDGGFTQIFVMNIDGKGRQQITFESSNSTQPRWSPDNEHILFRSDREGNWDLFIMNTDGTDAKNITQHPDNDGDFGFDWSPDGQRVAFESYRNKIADIYIVNSDGSGLINLTQSPGPNPQYSFPSWSPDGRKIVLSKADVFHPDLYIMDLETREMTRLTFTDDAGETEAAWGPLHTKGTVIEQIGWGWLKQFLSQPR
jgi:TolB protein